MSHPHRALTLLTATALALTGCGGAEEPPDPTTTTAPVSSSPATETTPEPSPTPATLPEAADGTDYDACYDGECEVLVTEPVDIPLDPDLPITATTASVTVLEGSELGVEFTADGQMLGSVTWLDTLQNCPGTIYTTFDGASMNAVACIEGQAIIAITVPN
jgi:hypothetical protein